jgi:chromosome segregation ATPase
MSNPLPGTPPSTAVVAVGNTETALLTPAEIMARVDRALATLEAARESLTKRKAAIPGVIAEELGQLTLKENQAREPIAALEAELAAFPGRIGQAKAGLIMTLGTDKEAAAQAALEHLQEAQRQAQATLEDARLTLEQALTECSEKRALLTQERQDYEAQLAEIAQTRAALIEQKRDAPATAGLQVVSGIRSEVEQLRGVVADRQSALEQAEAALSERQARVMAELQPFRDVLQVLAALGDLTSDEQQKSPPQILIAAVLDLLATFEKLSDTNVSIIPTTFEVTQALGAFGNTNFAQHLLTPEGKRNIIQMRASLLSVQERERRRLAGQP